MARICRVSARGGELNRVMLRNIVNGARRGVRLDEVRELLELAWCAW